jgi:hypothetical protein
VFEWQRLIDWMQYTKRDISNEYNYRISIEMVEIRRDFFRIVPRKPDRFSAHRATGGYD